MFGGSKLTPNYQPALELAQRALRSLDPRSVADRSGAELFEGEAGPEFRLSLLGKRYRVPLAEALVYDSATGTVGGVSVTLVVLHYLVTADGSPVTREWIPFHLAPGGNVYRQAFRQQCIDPLIQHFGGDPEALGRAAAALGGVKASMGDASYLFDALPRLPMSCVLWLGDEEQGAEVSLLFDAVAPNYLPTEDLAALGRLLAFGLVRAKGAPR
jgi:hypothetical protein